MFATCCNLRKHFSFLSSCHFETGSHIVQAGLKLIIAKNDTDHTSQILRCVPLLCWRTLGTQNFLMNKNELKTNTTYVSSPIFSMIYRSWGQNLINNCYRNPIMYESRTSLE